MLATSRERLDIRGEQVYPVPALQLPGLLDELTPEQQFSEVAGIASVELFVRRASSITHEFALSPENASSIAAICQRLEGLPLAIELAAAWIPVLPPASLLSRLDNRLPMLAMGQQDLPDRHRTLRRAIEVEL